MYLDTASSEPLHPAAREAFLAALDRGYADPRRLHASARDARLILDNAREAVAEALGVRRDEVSFTSSGTDAVQRGLLGLVRPDTEVAYSAVEHSAVLHALSWRDVRARRLPVDHLGRLEVAELGAAEVVALQHANHEVGTVQPVAAVGDRTLFMDACASMGRLPLPEGWAAAAGSAHKWGGPAGVGVLLVRKGARWHNPFPGDDRVDERSTGFENVPAALAAAAALRATIDDESRLAAQHSALTTQLADAARAIPDTEVFLSDGPRLPHLVAFSCLYVDGEALVTELDRRGFAVASGSACTASTLEPSHVLAAMGVLTHGNVRVSLGRDTDPAAVHRLARELPGVVARLRSEAGVPQ